MDINKYQPKFKGNSKKNLLSLENLSTEEIFEILHYAKLLKTKLSVGERPNDLRNKYVALITKRTFARSKVAFEIAVNKLNGNAITLPLRGVDIENIKFDKDVFSTFSSYGLDGIIIDTEEFLDANAIISNTKIPVINANSSCSPCVALASLLTVWECFGGLTGKKLALIGNLSRGENSLVIGAVKAGLDVSIACPREYFLDKRIIDGMLPYGDINQYEDVFAAVKNADAVFVAGADESFPNDNYKVTEKLMNTANPNAIFLHPLPVKRGVEVEENVIEGARSAVFKLAENILYAEMAALSVTIGKINVI